MPEKLPIQVVLAARMKAARKALGLSQAGVGVSMGFPEDTSSARVNRWELGINKTSLEHAEQLAEVLDIPFPALVSRDDRLAAVITGFTMLSKARQEEVWELIERSLGADRAEEVHERLGKATPKAKAKKKATDGRL